MDMAQRNNWDQVRAFLAVANEGSLLAAKKVTGLSPPTLSRRILAFEDKLGVRLFDRRYDGYLLTDIGASVLPYARSMDAACAQLWTIGQNQSQLISGAVKIAAGFWFSKLLMTHMPAFHAVHTDIDIEFVTSLSIADLGRGEADISIRNTRPTYGDLVLQKLIEAPYGIFGSKAYIADNPSAVTERLFQECDWIGGGEQIAKLASLRWLSEKLNKPPILKCAQTLQLLDAVKSNVGLTILPKFVGETEPDLVCLSDPIILPESTIWLVVHEDHRRSPNIRLVIDWLVPLIRGLKL